MSTKYKEFRERHLKISRQELAKRLGLKEKDYAEIEDGLVQPTEEFIINYCHEAQIDPTSLLNYIAPNPDAIPMDGVYSEIRLRKNLLDSYVKAYVNLFKDKEYNCEERRIDELYNMIELYSSKPIVAFMGPSDSGKSTLINLITGVDALLTRWTPTTKSTVILKHIDDRPEWMNNDTVWVFKAESDNQGWDFRRINECQYCNDLKIIGGDLSILTEYCNQNSKEKHYTVDSAVVYLDSDLLLACDIIDLPGFGTESYADDVQAQRALEKADVVVFLCQSNGFFNKKTDVLFFKDVINNIPNLNTSGFPLLSNLLVVATQAHIPGDKNLFSIFQRGKEVISDQISEDVIRERFEISKEKFIDYLEKRFFSYSIENSLLRKDFESELKYILSEVMPAFRMHALNRGIADLKLSAKKELEEKINEYLATLKDREQVVNEYKNKKANRDLFIKNINEKQEYLIDLSRRYRQKNCEDLKKWELDNITPNSVERIIRDKDYDKSKAQEYITSNVADLYLVETTKVVKVSVLEFKIEVEKQLGELEKTVKEWEKTEMGSVQIPFDVKGAWAGGLAGAGVLGALSVSAASLGNLGGYILVAKGVSLLSTLGISVGGTAAASSFVATIGGPITIGVALGLGAFFLFKSLFGERWETRLARQVHEVFIQEKVLEKYQSRICELWEDTELGIKDVSQNMIQKYNEQLEHMKSIINSLGEKELRFHIDRYREIRDFFVELPWGGSDIYYIQKKLLSTVTKKRQSKFNAEDIKILLRDSLDISSETWFSIFELEDVLNEKFTGQKYMNEQLLQQAIKETISQLAKNKVNFSNNKFYKNDDIRHKMMDGFEVAKKEIDIACAWMTNAAINNEMLKSMKKALRRGVSIKILYGIKGYSGGSSGKDKNKWTCEIAEHLKNKYGNKGLSLRKGNTHNKLFICDNNFYLIGSFNFLSYNPSLYEEVRDEIVEYSEDSRRIDELRSWYFNF